MRLLGERYWSGVLRLHIPAPPQHRRVQQSPSLFGISQPARLNLHHGFQASVSHLTLPISSTPRFQIWLLECVGAALEVWK